MTELPRLLLVTYMYLIMSVLLLRFMKRKENGIKTNKIIRTEAQRNGNIFIKLLKHANSSKSSGNYMSRYFDNF
jgi:hypothetical protein